MKQYVPNRIATTIIMNSSEASFVTTATADFADNTILVMINKFVINATEQKNTCAGFPYR